MVRAICLNCDQVFEAHEESAFSTVRCSCHMVAVRYEDAHEKPDLIQQRALETWHSKDKDLFLQLNHAILQLASEGGEVAALWAKFNYKPAFKLLDGMTREETFKAKLLDELGDVLYYLAVLAHLYGWTIEDISQHNYEKLKGGHGWKTPSQ